MKKIIQIPQFIYSFSGHVIAIKCPNTSTIRKLKLLSLFALKKYFAKDNINAYEIQGLYNGFFLLQDHLEVGQCLNEDQTVSLSLKKAVQTEMWVDYHPPAPNGPPWLHNVVSTSRVKRVVTIFESEKEIFLYHGASENFQSLLLKPERENKVKLKSKKFGIVYHTEGEVGNRIFHVRRYEIPEDMNESGSVKVNSIGNETKVRWVIDEGPNGEEKQLEEIECKAYYEKDRTGGKTMADYLSTGGSILKIINSTCKIVNSFIGLK